MTVQSILEKDKERLISRISGVPKQTVIREVQGELDRALIELNSHEESDAVQSTASAMIRTAKNCAGWIDTDGEARIYGQTEYKNEFSDKRREKPPLLFWILFLAGAFCLVLVILQLAAGMKGEGVGHLAGMLLVSLLAGGLLFIAGSRLKFSRQAIGSVARPGKEELHAEVFPEPERVYQQLLATGIAMDNVLDEVRAVDKIRERQDLDVASAQVDPLELDLMAQLLEDAYARKEEDEQARDLCAQLKYYLHQKKIDVVEYEAAASYSHRAERSGGVLAGGKVNAAGDALAGGKVNAAGDALASGKINTASSILAGGKPNTAAAPASWFDMIPAFEKGTIRPALMMDGKLLKKGLASNG